MPTSCCDLTGSTSMTGSTWMPTTTFARDVLDCQIVDRAATVIYVVTIAAIAVCVTGVPCSRGFRPDAGATNDERQAVRRSW